MLDITGLMVLGLALLFFGGRSLVIHGAKLAALLRVPSLIIGLTVVAYGTSSPEMMVNIVASWQGKVDIALGNIIGSNIFNIFFILGLAAFIYPLTIHSQILKIDIPMMILAALLTWLFAYTTGFTFMIGFLFIVAIIFYTIFLIHLAKKEVSQKNVPIPFTYKALFIHSLWMVFALLLLILGSRWLVEGASALATRLGLSELFISLTVVAAGTSLPELATSIIST